MCVKGAREALLPLLNSQFDFRLAWVFIDMMKTDTLESATTAASAVTDPRLTAFHDPSHLMGRAMAQRLGWRHHVAWDTYFIYRPGVRWTQDQMPSPDDWYHQLKDREMWDKDAVATVGTNDWTHALAEKSEADPARFALGPDLRVALERALQEARGARVHV